MIRTYVYVEGLNLYYGAVKRTEFKWLDLVKLVLRHSMIYGYSHGLP